jgi:hypothetical protein
MRLQLFLLIALSMAPPAFAQPDPQVKPDWIADAVSGCRAWNPYPRAHESIRWSGQCLDWTLQGHGVLEWFQDGRLTERSEGDFHQGRLNGWGAYRNADGSRYDGIWQNGRPHGQGKAVYRDGSVYEGIWNNGCWQEGNRRGAMFAIEAECDFK